MRPVRLILAMTLSLGGGLAVALWFGFEKGHPRSASVSREAIVEAVRKVARLATVEIEVEYVVRWEEVKTILLPIAGNVAWPPKGPEALSTPSP